MRALPCLPGTEVDTELRGHDTAHWGTSLANAAEIFMPLLEVAGARSVLEIGAYQGDLTAFLLEWAGPRKARISAVDPKPGRELAKVAERNPELDLIRERSHEALGRIDIPDAVIVDGDHNYYTVAEELRIIAERTAPAPLPLLILHDLLWPHGRRDAYYSPEDIPDESRQELVEDAHVIPDEPGIAKYGLHYRWAAAREGGERNGVLTAIEDFAEGRDGVRLAIIPAFYGVGVMWSESAPWAEEVARRVEPWDRNPVLARLERNRVYHLTRQFAQESQLERQGRILRMMLDSRAFGIADRLSRTRHAGDAVSWRDQVLDVLDAGENGEVSPRTAPGAAEAERP